MKFSSYTTARFQRGKTPEYYFKSQSKLEAPTPPLKQLEKLNLDNADDKKSEVEIDPNEGSKNDKVRDRSLSLTV